MRREHWKKREVEEREKKTRTNTDLVEEEKWEADELGPETNKKLDHAFSKQRNSKDQER